MGKKVDDTTAKHRNHWICDFFNETIINGDRLPILYRYGLKRPLDQKVLKTPTPTQHKKSE